VCSLFLIRVMVLIRDTQLDCVPEDKIKPFSILGSFCSTNFSLCIPVVVPVFNLNRYACWKVITCQRLVIYEKEIKEKKLIDFLN
jgi:hypothetical protein